MIRFQETFSQNLDCTKLVLIRLSVGFSGTVGGLHYKISNAAQAKVGLYFVSSFFELASISSIEIHVEQIGKLSVVVSTPPTISSAIFSF